MRDFSPFDYMPYVNDTLILVILGALPIYRSITAKEFFLWSPNVDARLSSWMGRPIGINRWVGRALMLFTGVALWVAAWWWH